MKLEVNKKHRKARLRNIKGKATSTILGTVLALTFFSGCSNKDDEISTTVYPSLPNEKIEEVCDEEIITETLVDQNGNVILSDTDLLAIKLATYDFSKNEYTLEELKNVTGEIDLVITEEQSYGWLNYCNPSKITFRIGVDPDLYLSDIKGFESIEIIEFQCLNSDNNFSINFDNYTFLNNCPNLKEITLININVEPGLIESLTNVKKLNLGKNFTSKLDYSKLTFLEEITIEEPYTIAMYLDNSELNYLEEHGVVVDASEEIRDINNKLDDIVSKLHINDSMTDEEKIQQILIYVLENNEYDSEVINMNDNLENLDFEPVSEKFYKNGWLYGALECETSICGNYSALVESLCDRVGINSFYTISNTHAWNLVEIDGQNYYIDATWMDKTYYVSRQVTQDTFETEEVAVYEDLKEGNTSNLIWYMIDPTNYEEYDKNNSHDAVNIPSYIKIEPIEDIIEINSNGEVNEEKNHNVQNRKFKITINKKTFIISGSVLIGLLSGLGIAFTAKNKRNRRRKNKYKTSRYYNEFNYNNSFNYNSFNYEHNNDYRRL